MKVLKEVNTKVKFLYKQIKCLKQRLKRLLCNALIQPNFDYGCTSWFSFSIKMRSSNKQHKNKCIRLCLDLPTSFSHRCDSSQKHKLSLSFWES